MKKQHDKRRLLIKAGLSGLAGLSLSRLAMAAPTVELFRAAEESGHTELVLSLPPETKHSVFTLANPERVVVDIFSEQRVEVSSTIHNFEGLGEITRLRYAHSGDEKLRIVLEVKNRRGLRSETKGKLLSLKLKPRAPSVAIAAPVHTTPPPLLEVPAVLPEAQMATPMRDIVVAIDAGHGGRDPGAVGRSKLREKDVVLSIAKKIELLLKNEPGFRPVLTRRRDEFIALRERPRRARRHKADMFVSVHADGFKNPSARGASVYAVSFKGATSEAARWLAKKENDADKLGGVDLSNRDADLASVLMDLSQTAAIQSSLDVGGRILKELGRVNHLHSRRVQQAGFAVLKSPDMPSILVESAFITNPGEEQKLRTKQYQTQVAKSILTGVKSYFKHQAIPGTIYEKRALKQYRVSNGDNLSAIAFRFGTTVDAIVQANGLAGDGIRAGQMLLIP